MPTQHHEILIHAPREHVWRSTLFSPSYERWTATFCEGSRYEGTWEAGTPIRFCGPNGDGMVAEIAEHRPAEFVSIRHLGMVNDGVADTTSETVRAWAPSRCLTIGATKRAPSNAWKPPRRVHERRPPITSAGQRLSSPYIRPVALLVMADAADTTQAARSPPAT